MTRWMARHPWAVVVVVAFLAGCGGSAQPLQPEPVTPAPVPNDEPMTTAAVEISSVITVQNTRNATFLVTVALTAGTELRVIYRNGSSDRFTAPVSTGAAGNDVVIDHVEPVDDSIMAAAYQIDPHEVRTIRLGVLPDNVTLVYVVRPVDPTDTIRPVSQWGATMCRGRQCEHLFLL